MSSSSSNRLPTAVKGGVSTVKTPANSDAPSGTAGRRRSSASSGLFGGLMDQKRNSQDASHQARKASFADQAPKAGIIGSMWNNFTKGTGGDASK